MSSVFVKQKVIKDGNVVGVIGSYKDATGDFYISKDNFRAYTYLNIRLSSDLKILSKEEIPIIDYKTYLSKPKILYHGSHCGLRGHISLVRSKGKCDFGNGFYTGEFDAQAKALICNDDNGVLYRLSANLFGLKIYQFEDELLWLLYVAVNRDHVNPNQYPKLRQICNQISNNDVVVGLIADDRMSYVYSAFVQMFISDVVALNAIKYVKLGNQYAFKTTKACSRLKIEEEFSLNPKEKAYLKADQQNKLGSISSVVESMKSRYFGKGRSIQQVLSLYK